MAQSLALSLLLLVLAFCIPPTQGSDGGAQDCCLKHSVRKIPTTIVRSYRKQEPSADCPISAILFSPRKRSQPELCADPKENWVKELMQYLDTSPAPQKARRAKKVKSGKKRRDSKSSKRTKEPQTPKTPYSLESRRPPSTSPGFGAPIQQTQSGLGQR